MREFVSHMSPQGAPTKMTEKGYTPQQMLNTVFAAVETVHRVESADALVPLTTMARDLLRLSNAQAAQFFTECAKECTTYASPVSKAVARVFHTAAEVASRRA